MHPSACKATAPSSLPPLMIPLLPALPTNHHGSVPRRRKPFCESSALSASSTTVSSSRRIWCCDCRTYRPAIPYANKVDSKEERRGKGGVLATVGQGIGDASGSFQLCWLMDKAGEEGRDRVSIVQIWSLFSTGSLEGGATPPA
jgi:hypothetical protein